MAKQFFLMILCQNRRINDTNSSDKNVAGPEEPTVNQRWVGGAKTRYSGAASYVQEETWLQVHKRSDCPRMLLKKFIGLRSGLPNSSRRWKSCWTRRQRVESSSGNSSTDEGSMWLQRDRGKSAESCPLDLHSNLSPGIHQVISSST